MTSLRRPRSLNLTLALAACLGLVDHRHPSSPTRASLDQVIANVVQAEAEGLQPVIIRARPGEIGLLKASLRARHLPVRAEFRLIDAVALDVPTSALRGLATDPAVFSVSSDAVVSADMSAVPLMSVTLRRRTK